MCHAQLGPGGLMLVPFDRARLYVLLALIRSVVRDSPGLFFERWTSYNVRTAARSFGDSG